MAAHRDQAGQVAIQKKRPTPSLVLQPRLLMPMPFIKKNCLSPSLVLQPTLSQC